MRFREETQRSKMARTKQTPYHVAPAAKVSKKIVRALTGKKPSPMLQQSEKKSYKYKPGTVALREIKRYQKSVELFIPKATFKRVVKEILDTDPIIRRTDWRVTQRTLGALQEAAEAFLVSLMEDANLCSIHAKRVTLWVADMQLAKRLTDRRSYSF